MCERVNTCIACLLVLIVSVCAFLLLCACVRWLARSGTTTCTALYPCFSYDTLPPQLYVEPQDALNRLLTLHHSPTPPACNSLSCLAGCPQRFAQDAGQHRTWSLKGTNFRLQLLVVPCRMPSTVCTRCWPAPNLVIKRHQLLLATPRRALQDALDRLHKMVANTEPGH